MLDPLLEGNGGWMACAKSCGANIYIAFVAEMRPYPAGFLSSLPSNARPS